MNQKILAVAVAAAMTVPSIAAAGAKTTVYGDFRWTVGNIDDGGADTIAAINNASRIGIKGHVGNSNLKAIYHLQAAARNDSGGSGFGSRFFFAGLKGGFGSIIYGRHSHAYKMAGLRVDPFYDTAAGLAGGGSNYGLSALTNSFTNNSIAYTSPKFAGGITANAAVYLDDGATDDHDFNIGIQYAANGITAGIQHIEIDGTGNIALSAGLDSATRFYGGYKNKQFSVGVSYEDHDGAGANPDGDYLYIAGTFKVAKDTTLAASYGSIDDSFGDARWNTDGDGFSVGVMHNILPKTTLGVLYSHVDRDAGTDRDVFGVMASHKFSLSNK